MNTACFKRYDINAPRPWNTVDQMSDTDYAWQLNKPIDLMDSRNKSL